MKSIILDFEGDKQEIPFSVSDFMALSSKDLKVEHNGDLYCISERIVPNFDEYTSELSTWDRNSALKNDMFIILKMKKV